MYKHILVPTDFSEPSERAAKKALELSGLLDARLSVVHAVNYLPPAYISAQSEYASAEQIIGRASDYLSEWAAQMGLGDAEQLVASGPAGREISAAAKGHGVDLIVIGNSGEGGIKRLLGSTTRAVMHNASCDVLAVCCE